MYEENWSSGYQDRQVVSSTPGVPLDLSPLDSSFPFIWGFPLGFQSESHMGNMCPEGKVGQQVLKCLSLTLTQNVMVRVKVSSTVSTQFIPVLTKYEKQYVEIQLNISAPIVFRNDIYIATFL